MIEKIKKSKVITCIFIIVIGLEFYKIKLANNFYKKHIGVNLPKQSTVLKKEDSHGGFHGDGEYYSEIQLTEYGVKEFTDEARKTGRWSSVPLPKDIKIIVYGGEYDGVSYNIGQMSKGIPKTMKNGIYYIKDRYAEKYPNEKNEKIYLRYAYNVTISILDFDTGKLYIYELDT